MDYDQRREYILGGHLDFALRELWWQRYNGVPRELDRHKLVPSAAEILTKPRPCTPTSFESLCWSMKTTGWKPGEQIRVAINHHGQILVTDGLHRSSAALTVGMTTVPVRVVFRADEWIALKYALLAANEDRLPLYQPVDHPDFSGSGWTVHRTDTARRAELIAADLKEHHASAVLGRDYACNAGVLTLGLARRGFQMQGIDVNAHAIRAAELMAPMRQLGAPDNPPRFKVCESGPAALAPADFVVVLSFLNHHQEDPSRHSEGHAVFRRCVESAPVVYLDAPAPGEPVGGSTEFVDPAVVFAWCAASGARGKGRVVAERGPDLSRPLLAWER